MAEFNVDIQDLSQEDLNNQLKDLGVVNQTVPSESEVPTDTPTQPDQVQQPSTEGIRSMDQVYQDRIDAGGDPRRPGVVGTAQDL